MYYTIFHTKLLEKFFDVAPRWTYDTAGSLVQKRIIEESKIINFYALIHSILILVSTIANIVPSPDDVDIHFLIYLGYEYSKTIGIMVSIIYRSFFVIVMIVLPVQVYQMITACFLGRFQIYMWRKCIEDITDENQILDKDYQNRLNKCLKFCINRHIVLNK